MAEFIRAIEVLEKLEDLGTKRKEKENLLKEHADNTALKTLFILTYDWMTTYGITSPLIKEKYRGDEVLPLAARDFIFHGWVTLMEALAKRQLTGNLARDAWNTFISQCNAREAYWFNRVLNRDLKVGVAETTVAKIWKDALSEFSCQLAPTDPYVPDQEMKFPVFVEPKYDGIRVLTVVKGNKATIHSRNGKELPGLQHFADAIASSVPGEYVIDGEVYHTAWNSTIKLSKTHDENLTDEERKLREGLVYYTFDYLPLADFQNGLSSAPLHSRRITLEQVIEKVSVDYQDDPLHIEVTPYSIAASHEEISNLYAKSMDEGYEGVMIKVPDSGYKFGRTKWWLKMKSEETLDGEIIEVISGTGRNSERLGAFKIKLENGETGNVGSGFSDLLREQFWASKDDLIGKVIEFKVQKDPTQVAVIRFPRFIRMRDDR